MSEQAMDIAAEPKKWIASDTARLAIKALTGVIAIFVAIKALAFAPGSEAGFTGQDHLARMIAFLALTVWIALTIGLRRAGMAAMIALAFASGVELLVLEPQTNAMATLVSANLGIVLAYCGLQLFAYQRRDRGADA